MSDPSDPRDPYYRDLFGIRKPDPWDFQHPAIREKYDPEYEAPESSEPPDTSLPPFVVLLVLLTAIIGAALSFLENKIGIFGYLFGAIGNLFAAFGTFVITYRIEELVYGLFLALVLCLTVALYRVRCRHRMAYGLGELIFGTGFILYGNEALFASLTGKSSAEARIGPDTLISLFAGLYTIIRGLTNIEESLLIRPGQVAGPPSRLQQFWTKAFHARWRWSVRKLPS